MTYNFKILLVEDEVLIRKFTSRMVQSLGCSVTGEASNGEQALEMMQATEPDLIILDINLRGGMDGLETARRIRANWSTPIISVSGYDFANQVENLDITNVIAYLQKPVRRQELLPVLENFQ